jgi:hypothetical protein
VVLAFVPFRVVDVTVEELKVHVEDENTVEVEVKVVDCKSISESSSTSTPELKLQVQPDRPRNLDLPLHRALPLEFQVVDESETYMTEELDISTRSTIIVLPDVTLIVEAEDVYMVLEIVIVDDARDQVAAATVAVLLTVMVLELAVNVPDAWDMDATVTALLELMEMVELDRVHVETDTVVWVILNVELATDNPPLN